MSFHARLLQQTADARAAMLTAPIIHSALRGDLTLASYLAFLGEAYHHVRHTVPLLGACRAVVSAMRAPEASPARRGTESVFIASECATDTPRAAGTPPKTSAFVSCRKTRCVQPCPSSFRASPDV